MRLNRCLTSKDAYNMEWNEFNRHARNELKRYARRWVKKQDISFDRECDKIIVKRISVVKYMICIYIEGDGRYMISACMENDGFEYKEWNELRDVDKKIIVGRLLFPNWQ